MNKLRISTVVKSGLLIILTLGLGFSSCKDDDDCIQNLGTEFYSFNIKVSSVNTNIKSIDEVYATYMGYDYPLLEERVARDFWGKILVSTNNKPWDYKFSQTDLWQYIPYTESNYNFLCPFLGFSYSADNTNFFEFGCLPHDTTTHTLVVHWNDGTPDDVLTLTRGYDENGKLIYTKTLNGQPVLTSCFEIKK